MAATVAHSHSHAHKFKATGLEVHGFHNVNPLSCRDFIKCSKGGFGPCPLPVTGQSHTARISFYECFCRQMLLLSVS